MTVLVPPDKSLTDLWRAYTAGKLAPEDLRRILELHYLDQDYTVQQLLQMNASTVSVSVVVARVSVHTRIPRMLVNPRMLVLSTACLCLCPVLSSLLLPSARL
ncbi:MAG: hypothetical protein HC767_11870 [Akkermansiaceae bacterium]|nr:hypothetical protein [Akkermansiaceae bacterium]